MLLNTFYEIKQQSTLKNGDKTTLLAQITINKSHLIFQGHFPGMPVMPGVCMVQIIKEIFQSHVNRSVYMTVAGNIKFLSVINPERNSELNVEISFTGNSVSSDIDARLYFGEITFFKMKCTLSINV